MEVNTSTSPLPAGVPKWLKLLHVFYKYLEHSPLRAREMWENPQIRIELDDIGFSDDIWYLRSMIHQLYGWHYLYRFGGMKWQGYSYLINLKGLHALVRHGLITEEQEEYARDTVLRILAQVDEKRYKRILQRLKW